MSISGIQNGVQASAEFTSMSLSTSSRAGCCNNNPGIRFDEQQLQDIINRLSQAFKANENCGETNNAGGQGCNSANNESGDTNEIKGLLEKLVNLLKSFMEKQGDGNQTQNANEKESGGGLLEKLLTAPLELAKTITNGIFGGNGGGLGGGLGGLLGGLFGGGK